MKKTRSPLAHGQQQVIQDSIQFGVDGKEEEEEDEKTAVNVSFVAHYQCAIFASLSASIHLRGPTPSAITYTHMCVRVTDECTLISRCIRKYIQSSQIENEE